MGKAKFWHPGAPNSLNGFQWNLEYITRSRVCPHMQIYVAPRQRGRSGRTRKKHMLWFLIGMPFFALSFGSRPARNRGPILTIYTSYDVFSPKDVPFGGLVHTAPQKPLFVVWIGIFKLNAQNINICILSQLLRRLQPNFAQSQKSPNILRGWS